MIDSILVQAEVRIPLDRIVDAVGPEIQKARLAGATPRRKIGPMTGGMRETVERVVSALDHLEIVTNTVGEKSAREELMKALQRLRKAHVKNRNR